MPLLRKRKFLLIIVVCCLVLAGTVVVLMRRVGYEAQLGSMEQLELACAMYHDEYGQWPQANSSGELARLLRESDCLIHHKWGTKADGTILDVWGGSLSYNTGGDGIEIVSPGPDRQHGTHDDYVVKSVLHTVQHHCRDWSFWRHKQLTRPPTRNVQ